MFFTENNLNGSFTLKTFFYSRARESFRHRLESFGGDLMLNLFFPRASSFSEIKLSRFTSAVNIQIYGNLLI